MPGKIVHGHGQFMVTFIVLGSYYMALAIIKCRVLKPITAAHSKYVRNNKERGCKLAKSPVKTDRTSSSETREREKERERAESRSKIAYIL